MTGRIPLHVRFACLLSCLLLILCQLPAYAADYVMRESGGCQIRMYDDYVEVEKYTGSYASPDVPASMFSRAVTLIDDGAFKRSNTKVAITSMSIGKNVKTIGDEAFQGQSQLTSVTFNGYSLRTIGWKAFADCDLQTLSLPYQLQTIDGYAFQNNTDLTTVFIPESVTKIGDGAFKGCTSLESVHLPSALKTIPWECFYGCSLESIVIPETVTSIFYRAFGGNNMTSVYIPDSVTFIEVGAFMSCRELQSVRLPSGLTEIQNSLFSNCTSLEEITIPEGVQRIGEQAFKNCESLTEVTIPANVTLLDAECFAECDSLEKIYVPDGIEIDPTAFAGTPGVTIIYYPSGEQMTPAPTPTASPEPTPTPTATPAALPATGEVTLLSKDVQAVPGEPVTVQLWMETADNVVVTGIQLALGLPDGAVIDDTWGYNGPAEVDGTMLTLQKEDGLDCWVGQYTASLISMDILLDDADISLPFALQITPVKLILQDGREIGAEPITVSLADQIQQITFSAPDTAAVSGQTVSVTVTMQNPANTLLAWIPMELTLPEGVHVQEVIGLGELKDHAIGLSASSFGAAIDLEDYLDGFGASGELLRIVFSLDSGVELPAVIEGEARAYHFELGSEETAPFTIRLTEGGSGRIPGDADDNGAADIPDALAILRYGAGCMDGINLANADVNADGRADAQDALLILQDAAGWDTELK